MSIATSRFGKGTLGLEPFRMLLNDRRFVDRPMILETPKGEDMAEDVENLRVCARAVRWLLIRDPPAGEQRNPLLQHEDDQHENQIRRQRQQEGGGEIFDAAADAIHRRRRHLGHPANQEQHNGDRGQKQGPEAAMRADPPRSASWRC